MISVWSLDDVLVGGSLMTPDMLYETFDDAQPSADMWTFWPNGRISDYCLFNTGSASLLLLFVCYCFTSSLMFRIFFGQKYYNC